MSPVIIKRMGLFYRQKESPYLLVTISGDLISYFFFFGPLYYTMYNTAHAALGYGAIVLYT